MWFHRAAVRLGCGGWTGSGLGGAGSPFACLQRFALSPARKRPRPRARMSSRACGEVRPPVNGLDLQVTGGDKFLILRNGSTATILVKGYDDEPYLRFLPSKVVQENTRSPSKYVNDDRYGLTPVPAPRRTRRHRRDGSRCPGRHVQLVRPPHPPDGEGHAAAGEGPRQGDQDLRLAGSAERRRPPGAAVGTLTWEPAASDSGSSAGPIVAIVGRRRCCCSGGAALLLSRRRRGPPPAPAGPPAEEKARQGGLVSRRRRPGRAARTVRADRAAWLPPSAFAHAVVEGTTPLSGADRQAPARRRSSSGTARRSRATSAPSGSTTARARRVDSGEAFHPGGTGSRLATRLKPDLPKGTYTATYR